jgi:hypothetical protein
MPTFDIPNGFAAVFMRYTNHAGHQCENVFGYAQTALDQDGVDDLSTALGGPLTDILSTNSVYNGLHVKWNTGGTIHEADSVSGTGAGGRGDQMSPPQVQHLTKKLTGIAGRAFRGRYYIPDVREDKVNGDGVLDATEGALMLSLGAAVFSASSANVQWGDLVILHPSGGPAPTVVTTLQNELKVATQRRRYKR